MTIMNTINCFPDEKYAEARTPIQPWIRAAIHAHALIESPPKRLSFDAVGEDYGSVRSWSSRTLMGGGLSILGGILGHHSRWLLSLGIKWVIARKTMMLLRISLGVLPSSAPLIKYLSRLLNN
jgi:hypothetical protein